MGGDLNAGSRLMMAEITIAGDQNACLIFYAGCIACRPFFELQVY